MKKLVLKAVLRLMKLKYKSEFDLVWKIYFICIIYIIYIVYD